MVLKDLDVPTFLRTMRAILEKVCVEALFHGNVSLEDAERAKKLITESLGNQAGGLPKKKYPAQLVTKIPLTQDYRVIVLPGKDPKEANTAVEVYVQVGKDNITERVIIDLLTHMMYEPFYDIVRTKSQFGYHVSCDSRWTDGVMGIHFQIVTDTKSAVSEKHGDVLRCWRFEFFITNVSLLFKAEATDQIDRFLTDYRAVLEKMSPESFLEHLIGLVKQKLDMFNSLSEETDTLWGEIYDARYDWQIHRNEAICLRNVTKQQVLEAYDRWLLPGQKRRMVVVQIIGSGETAVSHGRPDVDIAEHGAYADQLVEDFHKFCKGQTWGKIYL
jgi:nardilysin